MRGSIVPVAVFVLGYDDKRQDEHREVLWILGKLMVASFINKYKIIAVFHDFGIISRTPELVKKNSLIKAKLVLMITSCLLSLRILDFS